MTNRTTGRVTRSPALARASVRRMTIGTQRSAVDPCIRYGIDDLITRAAEHRSRNGSRSNAHEQHVIEADPIEAVLQRRDALDLVRLDHRSQHIANHEPLGALRRVATRQV